MPQLHGEVELDLIQSNLIRDLDWALDHRTWQFIRSAIDRTLNVEGTWLRKEVTALERRTHRLSDPDAGRSGVPAGHRRG